jgi:AcrR family transcriptional regulator
MADRESRNKLILEQREEQILNAAFEVFSQKGFSAATIPEIAGQAGIAPGTIYLYFQNKRDLFLTVIQKNLFTGSLVQIIEKIPVTDFSSIFEEIIKNRLDFASNKKAPQIFSLMGEIQRDPELREMFSRQVIQPFFSKLESLFGSRIKSTEFKEIDSAVIVRLIGGMIIGTVILNVIEGNASPLKKPPQEKIAHFIANSIQKGFMNCNMTDQA